MDPHPVHRWVLGREDPGPLMILQSSSHHCATSPLHNGRAPHSATVPRNLHGILWPLKYLNGSICLVPRWWLFLLMEDRYQESCQGRGAKPALVLQGAKMKQLGFPRAEQKTWKSAWISAVLIYLLKQSFTLWINKKGIFENILNARATLLFFSETNQWFPDLWKM